jgi:hypothetical protein
MKNKKSVVLYNIILIIKYNARTKSKHEIWFDHQLTK